MKGEKSKTIKLFSKFLRKFMFFFFLLKYHHSCKKKVFIYNINVNLESFKYKKYMLKMIFLVMFLLLTSISCDEPNNPCMGQMCQPQVEDCSNHAVCMSTLATCHKACQKPYDYACFSFCGAPFNSGEYKQLIGCAQTNGCPVDPFQTKKQSRQAEKPRKESKDQDQEKLNLYRD